MPKIATLILLIFLTHVMNAQVDKTPARAQGYWLAYAGDNKINSRIGIHSEAQLRNFLVDHNVETFLVRVGLNVYIKPYAMATAGYGYFYNEPSDETVRASEVSEHRIWQQLLLRQKHRYVFMDHRYRLEQRYLHNITNNTHQLDHRIRYRFQALFPLYSVSPYLRHLFVALNNEVMLNLKRDPARIYDRNRFFAGLGYQVSPKMNFQLGYLNQMANIAGQSHGHIDHIINFAVSYNMDDLMQSFFKKKQEE